MDHPKDQKPNTNKQMSYNEKIQLIQEINDWLDMINDHTIYSLLLDEITD